MEFTDIDLFTTSKNDLKLKNEYILVIISNYLLVSDISTNLVWDM